VPVEVFERIGDRRERTEDRPERQARVTPLLDELPERRSLDPVHDEHVGVVVEEEAVTNGRNRWMRPQSEQRASLREESVASDVGREVPDLQGHDAVVLTIDGTHDLGRAFAAEDLQQRVPVADHLSLHPLECRGALGDHRCR